MQTMTKNITKWVDNDKVAVLYSPGFGAGWYTWNTGVPEIIFDPAIVSLVLEDKWSELETYVGVKYPEIYTGGMKDLAIAWVEEGTLFKITEYDGSEGIELKENNDWMIA